MRSNAQDPRVASVRMSRQFSGKMGVLVTRYLVTIFFAAGIPAAGIGQVVGNCQAGSAQADLDANSVRARLYNTGGLFWKGAGGPLYNVPKQTSANAIFAHGIWIGGMVEGELRMAASDYGPWEFWPGPLSKAGRPPPDCSEYDRMYKVNRDDIKDFKRTGEATPDLRDWPHELGAPVIDGDGDASNYNLAGGDQPYMVGDQTVWWVMNDAGNLHQWSQKQPIGLEVQVLAWAIDGPAGFGETTYYKYRLIKKGTEPLEDAWFGVWTDVDLGDAGDDYVGCDTTRGLGYVWNGDDFDGGQDGYGDRPPAIGIDLVQGPVRDEEFNNLGATTCMAYIGSATLTGNPDSGEDAYRYMRGYWRDGRPITRGGDGTSLSAEPTTFMYPGDPPEYWSEENVDGNGTRNAPGDRRLLLASGPFDLDSGRQIDIIYAIIWAQGDDRYDSIKRLRRADAVIQVGSPDWALLDQIDPPRVTSSSYNRSVVLEWHYLPEDNNYLDSYDVKNAFLEDINVDDKTYSFEGYNVYRFASPADREGERIATFDVINGVTAVVDITDASYDIPEASTAAFGRDSGIEHHIRIEGLTNQKDYHFGVQAYAHNEHSAPRILKSEITRITARPSLANPNLEDVAIVPNPYKGVSDYEISNLHDVVRITNLPEDADIRIFTVAGTLVRELTKRGPGRSLDWDLLTDAGLPVGSGVYLVHIDARELGERVLKFGVVKKRIQLDLN